jgi:hypothetical protein
MSLEQVAAGLFNFNPVQGLQAGTSMGAQMMQIALQSQQQQLDAGAKWDQAMLSADRNALSRRTQMFNEMTTNLNRFDEQSRQKSAEAWATGGGGMSGGSSGGGSSVMYPQSEASPMPQSQPSPPQNFAQAPPTGFNEAPQQAVSEPAPAPAPMPIKTNQLPGDASYTPQPIGSGGGVTADETSFSGAQKPNAAPGGKPFRMGSSKSAPQSFMRDPGFATNPMTTDGVPTQMGQSPTAIQRSLAPAYRNQDQRQSFGQNAPAAPNERNIRLGQAPPQTFGNFRFDMRTRDEIRRGSQPGNRLISLDYNSSSSGGNYAMIVIPNDATDQERAAANSYVNGVTDWFRKNGVNVGNPVIKTSSENGRGVGGFFHTEPAFAENTAAMTLLRDKAPEYAQILAGTLGGIPGATFIPPHKKNDPGAMANGFPGERDFARQYIMPHLSKMAGGGMVGNLSAYSPRRGASNVAGSGGEGGYQSSVPGPDGVAEVRTLDDFASGRAPYVTVAGNPDFFGRQYTIPSISFEDARGNVKKLENVPAVVHDSGSAFAGAPEGRFDIPITRDAGGMLMKKNHARWQSEGVTFLPGNGERPQVEKIGTAPASPAQAMTMDGGPSQAQQFYGPSAESQQAPDFEQFPEYRAANEARTAYQQTLSEKMQNATKMAELRTQLMQVDQEMLAKDGQASMYGLRQSDPLYKVAINPLRMQRSRIENEILGIQSQNQQVLERENVLEKSAKDADAAWKIVQDRQRAFQRAAPDASVSASPDVIFDRYVDADPRTRMKMKASFVNDKEMMERLGVADEFLKSEGSAGSSQTWDIKGTQYTLADLAQFYTPTDPNDTAKPNEVQSLVESNPKLKAEVLAIKGTRADGGVSVNANQSGNRVIGTGSGDLPGNVKIDDGMNPGESKISSKVGNLLKRGSF